MLTEKDLGIAQKHANLKNRPRRTRRTENLRRMVRETHLSVDNFIYPLFIAEGINSQVEIGSMPGQYRWSLKDLAREAENIAKLGIPAVLLFGIPDFKDEIGSEAYNDNGVVQEAVRIIKKAVPELVVITDVCLCEFTNHGHCGVVNNEGYVLNDPTLDLLTRMAVSHAEAGADIIAPSDMMDGRVGAIREGLDSNGFDNIPIMSYSAKFASGYYGPFREAADSTPQFGDRRSYQMDPPNIREALRETELDIAEGADMIMVKPALAYLDIISRTRDRFDLPLAAYNVSGEYSMIKAAARLGWIDEERVIRETLVSIKRAGADMIITYHAKEAAPWFSR
ncbi:MAG: porphobilinogen synthase [Chloroflexi bacterium]|uniref:Delta-aminolevulinic acid dehydratase n=1 Tax=Candidatus Chlorohelix allophototropha TaxID=3003348 RepID=A0A8T7LYA9_9CHLR|nr:porphobilinogen synthase [Chloroflexota bacterium]WJW67157.1 porphobilinogen synthase [Chloroflexota bacterium L227-S17]